MIRCHCCNAPYISEFEGSEFIITFKVTIKVNSKINNIFKFLCMIVLPWKVKTVRSKPLKVSTYLLLT